MGWVRDGWVRAPPAIALWGITPGHLVLKLLPKSKSFLTVQWFK